MHKEDSSSTTLTPYTSRGGTQLFLGTSSIRSAATTQQLAMATALVATALRLVREYVRASDLALAAAVLFACSATASRASARGAPMMWPVLGVIPTLFAHLDDVYEWGTAALVGARGTFPYRGMWFGGSSGVVTSSPANVEHILRTNFANYPKGPYFRERFAELLGDGIFNADGDEWRAQRRAATAEMHSARFLAFSAGTIDRLVHGRLVPLLARVGDAAVVVDAQELLLRFTFDNICAAAFGVDTGCLADGFPDVPFARATELSLARFVTPPFVWKAKRRLRVGGDRELVEHARAVREFAQRTVDERRAEMRKLGSLDGRCDLLSRLMCSPPAGGAGGYSDAFLRDFCISFILAGRDTSSVALAWFFWLLASHPEVESRVLADVRAARGDVTQMDYLHAALTETMRLYPPVPADFKEAVADDVLPDGSTIRAGQRVIYYTYAMGRDAAAWGPDCLEFRPERWMKGGRFTGNGESPFKYVVFNAGPRLCIGKRFAYTQMKTAAAVVLDRFRVEVLPGQEVKPKLNTTLYMKNGLMVRFTAREQLQEPQVAEVGDNDQYELRRHQVHAC
jgi:cytochrome P450